MFPAAVRQQHKDTDVIDTEAKCSSRSTYCIGTKIRNQRRRGTFVSAHWILHQLEGSVVPESSLHGSMLFLNLRLRLSFDADVSVV